MVSKSLVGWILVAAGTALWTYGYLASPSTSFLDWKAMAPWWIADYLPSKEAELGLVVMCLGMIPLYWPTSQEA